ncbi:DNA-directed DNA polymerase [Malassezia vespertilionis]|uniref:DNA-directed DNA polymerase n=1 Tax=Malassezia vespertilionis TaxID=2020962 RepID=UPI0024B07E01|nr:DNA-directed DNA polymerase [Malassezia vespertilionis]WFD07915.1 DNA-directed DNA polymerase [Malassezia vespertilionis]
MADVHVPPDVRREILRAFTRKYHLQLRSDAVQFVCATLQAHGLLDEPVARAEAVEALANALVEQHFSGASSAGFDGLVVTSDVLCKVYDQLVVEGAEEPGAASAVTMGDTPNLERYFHVCDAFKLPRIRFNGSRKIFEPIEKPASLLSSPASVTEHLAERYELLRSVVLRNEHFLPPLAAGARESHMKLTTTKNLLGRQGQNCLLFGRLSTTPDGQYVLEDTEGSVHLDLDAAIAGEGIFTEGSFVLVEGEYTMQERLHAFAIGHPPSESRDEARSLFGHVDFTGTGAVPQKHVAAMQSQEMQHPDLSFAVFSDVHLDHENSLSNLRAILQGYGDADFIPFCLVLCGNFTSVSMEADEGNRDRFEQGFLRLAELLQRFPHILEQTHLVLIPGPADPVSTPLLPRARIPAPLVASFEQSLPSAFVAQRLHWASNPCKLVYFSQEMVIFRDDIMSKMLRSAVRLKDELRDGDLQKFLVSTLLDQAHLCPLPQQVRPVLWEHANAMRLYPMPSALVLADRYERFELTYEGCHVFNPGSFRGQMERSELQE